jgi:hypothetical protein
MAVKERGRFGEGATSETTSRPRAKLRESDVRA